MTQRRKANIVFVAKLLSTEFDQLCSTGGLGRATLIRSPVFDELLTIARLDQDMGTLLWQSSESRLKQWSTHIWALWLACAIQYHLSDGSLQLQMTHQVFRTTDLAWNSFYFVPKKMTPEKSLQIRLQNLSSARMPSLVKWQVTDDSPLAAQMKLDTLQIARNKAFLQCSLTICSVEWIALTCYQHLWQGIGVT